MLSAALLSAGAARAADPGKVSGLVLGESNPIAAAKVYAYHLADSSFVKVVTDADGEFLFEALPEGLYRIFAFKAGFEPRMAALSRPDVARDQVLQIELAAEEAGDARAGESYWSLVAEVPPDILRDVTQPVAFGGSLAPRGELVPQVARVNTEISLGTGVDAYLSSEPAAVTGGAVDMEMRLGSLEVGLEGDFWRIEESDLDALGTDGSSRRFAFDLGNVGGADVSMVTSTNRLVTHQGGAAREVGFDDYRLQVSRNIGQRSSSGLAIQVTDEENFYRLDSNDPLEIPQASRTFRVEGSFNHEISERNSIETGVRYRELEAQLVRGALVGAERAERLDLFGRGGYRVRPKLLLEYGVFTTMRDGNVSFMPQGGVVVQLSSKWQASASVSQRVEDGGAEALRPDFLPVSYRDSSSCELGEQHCYRVELSRRVGDDTLAIGAIHREFGETLRLFFSDDFFDQLESLYIVSGDSLPEVQLSLARRLSPTVLTRFESNLAAGGGGTFYGSDATAFDNEVRYLRTSVDTQFQSTGSGLFVAFHHLEQDLRPTNRNLPSIAQLNSQRLEVRLTQDLNSLIDLPANWAVHLDMQVSDGESLGRDEDELRRRFLGGLAVKF